MVTRRCLLRYGVLAACAPGMVLSQTRRRRIGVLSALPAEKSVLAPMLRKALAELGYRDGVEIDVDFRYAGPATTLARELVDSRCDVVFALGGAGQAGAFRGIGKLTPVVFIATTFDPVEAGIVESLARPGRNITGVYVPVEALAAKRFELAKEILPQATRYLVLVDRATRAQAAAIERAARQHGAQVTSVDFETPPHDLPSAFEAGRKAGVQAVFLQGSARSTRLRTEFSSLLVKYRLPAFVPAFMANDEGSLASYSVDIYTLVRRAAEQGVRILGGIKPADIPVEGPDEYELIVSLRRARALGVAIPPVVLARATRIVE